MVQAKNFYLVLVLPHPVLQNKTEEVSSWPKGSTSNENLEFQTEKKRKQKILYHKHLNIN